MGETKGNVVDVARERVRVELAELNNKIVNLSAFLFSEDFNNKDLSEMMKSLLSKQLDIMQHYALILQERLRIWDLKDEEIKK